jgi:DNA-binding SARP family transcriptional activator
MLRVRMFGGLTVERDGVPVSEIAEQHKALAILALVAAADERGVSRDRLAAYIWPDSDAERARGALSQTIYTLRKQLGEPELFAGTRTLRLNAALIGSDLRDFNRALDRNDRQGAVALYAGPFLHGFFVPNAPELERWMEEQRAVLQRRVAAAVESLARGAAELGEKQAAVSWWRWLNGLEPGNSRVAAALISTLADAGDRAGALEAATAHETFLRTEFEAPPDPVVSALANEIRRGNRSSHHRGIDAQSSVAADRDGPPVIGETGGGRTVHEEARQPDAPSRSPARPRSVVRLRAVPILALGAFLIAVSAMVTAASRHSATHATPVFYDRRVRVAGFENETGDSALAFVGRIATDWVIQGLLRTQLVEVVGPGVRVADLPNLGDSALTPRPGLIVRGSYSRVADSLIIQAQVEEASTGRVVRGVGPVAGPVREPLVVIERLRQQLAGALATRVDRRLTRWSDAASQPVSFAAYRAFDQGLDAFFSPDDSSDSRAGRLLVHAASLDTSFSLPLLWALYAFNNAGDPVRFDSVLRVLESRRERLAPFDRALLDAHAARARGDPMGEYEALRRLIAIAPNSEWLFKLALAASGLHRMEEADSLLSAVDPDAGWMRDWGGYWSLLADIRYYKGRHEAELTAAHRLETQFAPSVPPFRRMEGRALAALGRDSALVALADEAIQRAPGVIDFEQLFRSVSSARVHGHLGAARAIARRSLRFRTTGVSERDPARLKARSELLAYEAAEMWDEAASSAKRLRRADSLAGRHDALPYMVLLQAALHRGALGDTAGLEARALAEIAARPKSDGPGSWVTESPLAVRAELAALHRDVPQTATLLKEAVERGVWEYYWFSERPAFDAVRTDPALAGLLHNPATIDRRSTP